MKDINDLNSEIERLTAIKYEVEHLKQLEIMKKDFGYEIHLLSQHKYDEIVGNNKINNDDFYYIIEPEIGQYIKSYLG